MRCSEPRFASSGFCHDSGNVTAMRQIALPGRDRRTSQLGFGCAYLTPENASVLDVAFEAGVRHFDVARSYGSGLTEGILGSFVRRHRGEVTVTSKFGIVPPFSHPIHALLRRSLKPIIRRFRKGPILASPLGAAAGFTARRAVFTGESMRSSLALSLRNLQVSGVDLFLMHEADASELQDPGLLAELQDSVLRGKIGAFGVGGRAANMQGLLERAPAFCAVLQYDWHPLQPVPDAGSAFHVVYRAHAVPGALLRTAFAKDHRLVHVLSAQIDHDLERPGEVERLYLVAAAERRQDALVLFSSTNPDHIRGNVAALDDPAIRAAARKLVTALPIAVLERLAAKRGEVAGE